MDIKPSHIFSTINLQTNFTNTLNLQINFSICFALKDNGTVTPVNKKVKRILLTK